jgi:GNAT superfamily N-acetyltransferase
LAGKKLRAAMLGPVDAGDRAQAIAFMCTTADRCAEEIIDLDWGRVLLDARQPELWDANHLRVQVSKPPNATKLVAAAERHLAELAFRMIVVLDEGAGRALSDPLQRLGYGADHQLLMTLAGSPSLDQTVAVCELERDQLAQSRIESQLGYGGGGARVAAQLLARDVLLGAALSEHCFGVLDNGRVLARCQLYSSGSVAQIDHVYTSPRWRRRGFSRALLAHAAERARKDGARTVFLVTSAADWPQRFYRRIGFADAGLVHRFMCLQQGR